MATIPQVIGLEDWRVRSINAGFGNGDPNTIAKVNAQTRYYVNNPLQFYKDNLPQIVSEYVFTKNEKYSDLVKQTVKNMVDGGVDRTEIQNTINTAVTNTQKAIAYNQSDSLVSSVLPISLAFIAPGIGSAIGSALAPAASAAVQAAIGSAVVGGTVAEATGGDFLKGALTSAVGSGIGSATAPITSSISEAVGSQALGQALAGGAMAELQGGDFVQGAIQGGLSGAINDAKLAAAEEYLKSIPPAYTYESDLPTLNVVPGDTVGIVEAPITVDTSFTPDYSLSPVAPVIPEMGAQGIQVPTINEVIDVVNQPVDYSLPIPETNLGLTIPAVLGDESSFINQPVPDVSVNIPEIVEQPKDISGELAALDAAKALAPLAAGALTAGAVVNAIQEDQPTGFEIVPIPADWRSPEYNMAFMPLAPIDFGTRELLRGTQWENPQIQAPKQYSISDVVNALNYQSVPFVQQNYEIPHAQMTIPDILEQFNVKPTVGVNDIIGNLGGRPMSISDIISGIQSGQTYSI